ncbi:hypothetical protein ACSQ67_020816 [Phaseolus vulgaris]
MDNPKQTLGSFAVVLSLLFAGVILLFHWSSSSNELVLIQNQPPCKPSNFSTSSIEECGDALECALAKASMGNKTVIIAMVNKAYAEQDVETDSTMLDIFLSSFWVGEGTRSLIHHILLVAVDQVAYDRCMFLKMNCFRLEMETDGVDFEGEKVYMSEDFIKMMWRRTWFLLEVLKRGYTFVFTDTDVMWLRNPFTRLNKNETEDLQISTDMYYGDPWSKKNPINTGFYFVRSNNKTISLFETWYGEKDNSTGKKEQDVLLDLIRGGIIEHLEIGVRSINAKVADMKVALSDWKRFKRLDANSTLNPQWTKHDWCRQSWGRPKQTKG